MDDSINCISSAKIGMATDIPHWKKKKPFRRECQIMEMIKSNFKFIIIHILIFMKNSSHLVHKMIHVSAHSHTKIWMMMHFSCHLWQLLLNFSICFPTLIELQMNLSCEILCCLKWFFCWIKKKYESVVIFNKRINFFFWDWFLTVFVPNLRVRYCIYGNSEKFPSATKLWRIDIKLSIFRFYALGVFLWVSFSSFSFKRFMFWFLGFYYILNCFMEFCF